MDFSKVTQIVSNPADRETLIFSLCFFYIFFSVIASDPYVRIPSTVLFLLEPGARWAKTKTNNPK